MKRETKTYSTVVFVAFDGKEFDNAEECEAYEKNESGEYQCVKAADAVPHRLVSNEWLTDCACDSDVTVVFIPRDEKDIDAIKAWADFFEIQNDINYDNIGEALMFSVTTLYYHGDDSLFNIEYHYYYMGNALRVTNDLIDSVYRMVDQVKSDIEREGK